MDKIIKICTIFFIACPFSILFSQSVYQKKYVKVIISSDWTIDSLNIAQKRLKEIYHIDLYYNNLKFRDDGVIKSIDIKVNTNDGYSGSAEIQDITKKNQFGFIRDYKIFAKDQFIVGFLEISKK